MTTDQSDTGTAEATSIVPSAKWSQMLSWIWEIRDKDLRFHYERHEVGDVILPMVVLRRLDLVLAPTKAKVLAKAATLTVSPDDAADLLAHIAGQSFYNTSKMDFETLVTQDPDNILDNTLDYLNGFSPNVRDIITRFGFTQEVEHMAEAGILLRVLGKIASPRLDLSPKNLSNMEMGSLYEELLRLASDLSNKEAGDHFTPREVISLMVSILVSDTPDLHIPGKVFTVYDPACGTGGMLTEAEHHLLTMNPQGRVHLFGEEIALKSHAVCTSDMLIKGQDASRILRKDTLDKDGFPDQSFDYVLANPPYGVDWSESEESVRKEHGRGFAGRFGAGLPGRTDGQLLFLQHMVAKAKNADEGGSRVAVVLNASPLFAGDGGSGESNIRRWLFENDYIEAIIGLPDQLFYNTGIYTYIWVLSTAKRPERQGLVQLIDARELFDKMPKSLGNKRNELGPTHVSEIVALYESFAEGPRSKIMRNEEFGYTKVVIEHPLRMRYESNEEARALLRTDKVLAKLRHDVRDVICDAADAEGDWSTSDRSVADARVAVWAAKSGKTTKATRDALLAGVGVLDPSGDPVVDAKGSVKPDTSLRDAEYIPLSEDVDGFIAAHVMPFAPDAWADRSKDRVGYEVPFAKIFQILVTPRAVSDIDDDLRKCQQEIIRLLAEEERMTDTKALVTGALRINSGGLEVGSLFPLEPLKRQADLRYSNADKKTVEGQIPVLLCNYTDVYKNDEITAEIDFMSATASKEQVERLELREGDVLFTKDSETPDDIAVPAFVPTALPGVICGYHLAIARPIPGKAYGKFLYWVMQSKMVAAQFEVAATGVTRYGLKQSSVGDVLTPAPPLDQQIAIAEHLDRVSAHARELLAEFSRAEALLVERKQALITSITAGPTEVA